jgi:signal transduction histidine kinase
MRGVGRAFGFHWRILSVATLVLVVAVLAILQYRWITELSEVQESRTASRLREEAFSLADAVDTEVTRAALAIEIPMVRSSEGEAGLERAWSGWKRDARWPRLVSRASFSEPAELRALLVDGRPAFLRPAPMFPATLDAPHMNWLLIQFDARYLADVVFPRLLEEHATSGDRADFEFEIQPGAASGRSDIATADVFRYRPDCLTTPVTVSTQQPAGLGGFSTALSTAVPGHDASVDSVLHAVGRCRIPVSESDRGLMRISVRSRQGSLSGVFAQFRRRNEFLGALVLAALLAALTVLIVSTERARKLAQLQTVVAAGISHELRTPLASLRVAADDLKNGHVRSEVAARQYGEVIEVQSRRLEHVVDQALAFARSTQSKTPPRLCAVSVAETFDAVLNAVTVCAAEAKVEIEWRIAPGVPKMLADPELAFRCVANLVENSIRYAGHGGWILLAARPETRAGRALVEVTVEDRGPGIPDEERQAVFEPFYRGSTARRSRRAGSGLGLSIVKNAMEAGGGSIQLEGAAPHGCRFRLIFPAAGAEVAE